MNDLVWHPSHDYLVFIRKEDKEVGLIRVVRDKQLIIRLEQVGSVIKFEGSPMAGIFSKDGRSLFVLDKGDAANQIPGKVFQVRLSLEEEGGHVLLSKADVGFNPLHISVNPAGDYLFVSNLGRERDENGSVSVLSFKNGNLMANHLLLLEGFFPSRVIFDKNGKNFGVACFQSRTYGKPMGNICFYRFSGEKIEKQAASILVPSGVHYMEALF